MIRSLQRDSRNMQPWRCSLSFGDECVQINRWLQRSLPGIVDVGPWWPRSHSLSQLWLWADLLEGTRQWKQENFQSFRFERFSFLLFFSFLIYVPFGHDTPTAFVSEKLIFAFQMSPVERIGPVNSVENLGAAVCAGGFKWFTWHFVVTKELV